MTEAHRPEDHCIKHGSYAAGRCPQCVDLLEARLILLQQAEHVRAAEAVESQKMIEALTAKYEEIMGALRRTKMEHGLCEPKSRRACTRCMAEEKIEKALAEYKGPRVRLA